MFRRIAVFAGVTIAVVAMPPTSFAKFVNISQQCNYDCLKSACDKAGGQFNGNHTQYWCNNEKKDTSVHCNNSVCSGTVPLRARPGKGGISGILQSGPVAARLPGAPVSSTRPSTQPTAQNKNGGHRR